MHRAPLFVATDADGVQRLAEGELRWVLPEPAGTTADRSGERPSGEEGVTRAPGGVLLFEAAGLLDALDERVFLAAVVEAAAQDRALQHRGAVRAAAARLVAETPWDERLAAGFALDCAGHVLGDAATVPMPHHGTLGAILADARGALEDPAGADHEHLGYLARLAAWHRLRRDRAELSRLELTVLADDERRDLDALDDPDYEVVLPITEAVLAALEALRRHVLPHAEVAGAERREEREEHEVLEGADDKLARAPLTVVTPFGNLEEAPRVESDEPAWTSARRAARQARRAAAAGNGGGDEAAERRWQAERLLELLVPEGGAVVAGAPGGG